MARNILPALVSLIDSKLEGNTIAQEAIKSKNPRLLMVEAAQCLVGIREKGNNRGYEVELIQKTVDGKAQGEPWCLAYVESIIAYCEVKTGVKSPLKATEHCMTLWNATPSDLRVKGTPMAGAVVIWRHGNSTSGHTGIIKSAGDRIMSVFEGNTTHGVDAKGKVVRDGGGCYLNKRDRKGSGSMKVMGFIKPFA